MASNQAAWLDAKGKSLRVGPSEMPKAGPGQVVVRNHAIAVNPIDWKVQDYGLFLKKWPALMGGDVAGEVVEVGPDVKNFKKGDRVTSHVAGGFMEIPTQSGFQLYTAAPVTTTALIPESTSYADASVLPLCFDTAIVSLCSDKESGYLGLPFPSLNPKSSGKVIIVWGGSSSAGANGIQLAVAAGVKVIATASSHNFDLCRECGASEVFDYKSKTVVEDIIKAVKSSESEFAGVFDAVSIEDQSMSPCIDIVDKLGGGNMVVLLTPPENKPSSVKIAHALGWSPITHGPWKSYFPQALKEGTLKCLPPPLIVGNSLDAVQSGLDLSRKGVSGKKIVIEL